jgi:hypothetical protein
MIDSVRGQMSSVMASVDQEILATEASTAQTYRAIAELIDSNIDRAVGTHPVFARRDSVRARGEQSRVALAAAQNALTGLQMALSSELTRLQGNDAASALRPALASAQTRRAAAEGVLVAVVQRELDARATELIASLRRDTEAAEFGSASASFFQALEAQGRTPNAPAGTTGAAGGMTIAPEARPAPVATTSRPQQ